MSATAESVEIPMPRLSDAMEEGTIVQWLKASGEEVAVGEAIVEIETDKATMEYEAESAGILQILAETGATVTLGKPIARLLPPGSEISDGGGRSGHEAQLQIEAEQPPVPRAAKAPAPAVRGDRVLATPIARRMARELGLALAAIRPSGRRGQIVKADVEAHAGDATGLRPTGASARATADGWPPIGRSNDVQRTPLTRTQRTIAQRMAQSRATVPDFEVSVEIEMDACLRLREELAAHLDPLPSVNDMVVRACALALREHPRANGVYREEAFELHEAVNVGIAVAAPDALLVAVIPDADRRPLAEIARESRRLAARARSGEITPRELAGATFTVSNLGMFGVDRFSAIINAPQAAILAVGAATERPIVRDGRLTVGRVMTVTLAADHRILYGADAARFITDVRERLQAPLGLLV
ncbi:MAG TPA: dihydrolipoamide acetyltransferase family protein [Solirubrobacteraceae bacterium]|nr:dihydrolipoamide acetyltransferase family protein [Solirubrobacteraceae bacterium]